MNEVYMFSFLKSKKEGDSPNELNKKSNEPDSLERPLEKSKDENPKPNDTNTKKGFFAHLRIGLTRTRTHLSTGLSNLFLGKKVIDAALFEQIETQLLLADVGIEATQQILAQLTESVSRQALAQPEALRQALKQALLNILEPVHQALILPPQLDQPFVILMVGINGAGKTTTTGKLAKQFQQQGRKVLLAAGDTFRAAAIEQLQAWGERNNIPVITQQRGADSASVVYDALQAAKARHCDVLIADTAGRLHTQANLMEELKKIKRVMSKVDNNAPHEVLLVLDAGTGQNALVQAQQFNEAVKVSGIALTKLDGTAKGGIIFAIAKKTGIPIRYIGVGEAIDDLQVFEPKTFVEALFEEESTDH
jgi:fused signal recognition particle receptor